MRLEHASARRQREFLAAVRRSRRLHAPWIVAPASAPAYRRYLVRSRRPTQIAYFVIRRDTNELAGIISVSEIVHGNFQSAYLGDYAFTPHAGHGLMRVKASPRSRYLHVAGTWRDHQRWALLNEDWRRGRGCRDHVVGARIDVARLDSTLALTLGPSRRRTGPRSARVYERGVMTKRKRAEGWS